MVGPKIATKTILAKRTAIKKYKIKCFNLVIAKEDCQIQSPPTFCGYDNIIMLCIVLENIATRASEDWLCTDHTPHG